MHLHKFRLYRQWRTLTHQLDTASYVARGAHALDKVKNCIGQLLTKEPHGAITAHGEVTVIQRRTSHDRQRSQ